MPNEEQLLQDYRGAVSLNNMGVALLEQRAYHQGMETLKDAIFVMKRVLHPASRAYIPPSNVQAKIDRANKRIASPDAVPSSVATEILSPSFNHSTTVDSVLRANQSSVFAIPIRIEEVHPSEHHWERDQDLESAIMLFNFGLAHTFLSKMAKCPAKLRDGALKLFRMSYAIVSIQSTLAHMSNEEMQAVSEARLLLAVAVLNSIVQALTEMGRDTEAYKLYLHLIRLGSAISEMDEPEPFVGQISGAAAA